MATGLGVVPFFLVDEVSPRWLVGLWGAATGLMLTMSGFLVYEGIEAGGVWIVAFGFVAGYLLIWGADLLVGGQEVATMSYEARTQRTLVLVVGAIFVHSIPEGIAVGVAFADLGMEADLTLGAIGIPALAVTMTLAVAILNIPEGLAVAIPLRSRGISRWRVVAWAIFTGLPQPVFATIAYVFVLTARDLLPLGLGFAAGTLLYLIFYEFIPAARTSGKWLPYGGRRELLLGAFAGALLMPLLLLLMG